jgi:hypothetical protein
MHGPYGTARGTSRKARRLRAVLGLAAMALLAVSVVALAGTLILTARTAPVSLASGQAVTISDDGWVPLRSTAPADVLAAARQSPLLEQSTDDAGNPLDLSRLGTPVLVYGLAARSAAKLPDAFVIPMLDRASRATRAAEAELNAAHTALHVTAVVTFTRPRPAAIAASSAASAVARVTRQRHTTLRASAQPDLVYFPVDAQAQVVGAVVWRAGGEYPADPVWRVPGADGHDYFVGTNGAVYTLNQLPIAASA